VLRRDMRAAMGVLDTYRAGRESLARVAPDLVAAAARMEQDSDLAYIQENCGTLIPRCRGCNGCAIL
jgi:hypothetical protein